MDLSQSRWYSLESFHLKPYLSRAASRFIGKAEVLVISGGFRSGQDLFVSAVGFWRRVQGLFGPGFEGWSESCELGALFGVGRRSWQRWRKRAALQLQEKGDALKKGIYGKK
ncbi:hypothetical protein COLO4_08078 [Corchorus olitorius]|uniref:Uncharacterized protein n=1 Tax=Corchorus olitorius TaxID=93759 RepID=A0A1R3KHH1_9ROSI|nr:hypothetical protein COLO4_08078 [Corchorus olitorius]